MGFAVWKIGIRLCLKDEGRRSNIVSVSSWLIKIERFGAESCIRFRWAILKPGALVDSVLFLALLGQLNEYRACPEDWLFYLRVLFSMLPVNKMPNRLFLTLLFLSSQVAIHATEVYWPGWLGPDRDGRVGYFNPPSEWPRQLKKAWSLDVGTGSSAPVVVDGRIYQHARQAGDEVVWSLDLETGKTMWRKSYRVDYRISSPGERHGDGPLSNATFADGRLFTLSVTGILSAWHADTGELLWRRDYADRFRITHPAWGHSTSPLVDGDRVIVHFGSDDAGVLVALDVATGKEVWTEGEDGACHASPILVELQGVRQIVEWNDESVVGIESATGRRLWDYDLPHSGSNQNSPTPVYHEGRILVGGENRGIRSLEPRLKNGRWKVIENWHQRDVSLNMATAVMSDGSLYGLSHLKRGQFFCLDPIKGEILWEGPPRMGEYATFLTVPGYIVVLRDDAMLEIIPSGEVNYRAVATYEVAESATWTAPVILKDGILIKDRTKLFRWSFE